MAHDARDYTGATMKGGSSNDQQGRQEQEKALREAPGFLLSALKRDDDAARRWNRSSILNVHGLRTDSFGNLVFSSSAYVDTHFSHQRAMLLGEANEYFILRSRHLDDEIDHTSVHSLVQAASRYFCALHHEVMQKKDLSVLDSIFSAELEGANLDLMFLVVLLYGYHLDAVSEGSTGSDIQGFIQSSDFIKPNFLLFHIDHWMAHVTDTEHLEMGLGGIREVYPSFSRYDRSAMGDWTNVITTYGFRVELAGAFRERLQASGIYDELLIGYYDAVITSLDWSMKDLYWRLTRRLGSGQERSLVIEKLVEIGYITEKDMSG